MKNGTKILIAVGVGGAVYYFAIRRADASTKPAGAAPPKPKPNLAPLNDPPAPVRDAANRVSEAVTEVADYVNGLWKRAAAGPAQQQGLKYDETVAPPTTWRVN